jgi:hypothetical protein
MTAAPSRLRLSPARLVTDEPDEVVAAATAAPPQASAVSDGPGPARPPSSDSWGDARYSEPVVPRRRPSTFEVQRPHASLGDSRHTHSTFFLVVARLCAQHAPAAVVTKETDHQAGEYEDWDSDDVSALSECDTLPRKGV